MEESIVLPHLLLLISICLGGLVDRNTAQSTKQLDNFSALSLTFDRNQAIDIKRANISSQRLDEETSNAVSSQLIDSESISIHTVNVPFRTQYLVLTAYWENKAQLAEIQLIDPEGNIIPESDFEQYDIKLAFDSDEMRKYSSSSRSKSAHIRNPQWGSWQIQIVNPDNLGEISYGKQDGIVGRIVPEMDILPGIEQIDESKFKISYEIEDPDSDDIRVDFYGDINQEGYNGLSIDRPIASIPVSKGRGSYILDTEGFAPGEYYIYAEANDNFARKKSYIDGLSNYSLEKITLVREADISASITADTDEVYIGDTITYTVSATNESEEFDSREVKMLVNLPENLEIISTGKPFIEGERGTYFGADLIFDVGDLQPGETNSVEITVEVVPESDGTLTYLGDASVLLQSKTYDPNPDNSGLLSKNPESKASVEVNQPSIINLGPKPFLTLERIDPDLENLQVDLNTRYSYDIVITNTGDAVATGVTIEENIDGLDGQLSRVTTTQGNYAYNRYSDIITANLGSIAPGETATVTVEVTAQAAGKRYTSSTLEYNEKQVVDEITTTTTVEPIPVPAADLELTQTIDNLNPLVGEQVNITLNLVNQGPGIASGIEVTNLLPEGLSFVRANAALGNYNSTTGIWNAGNIRDGVRTSLTITALVEDAGSITNQAEITFTDQEDSDSTPGNGDPIEDDFAAVTIEAAFP